MKFMFVCLMKLLISDKDHTKRKQFGKPLKRFKLNAPSAFQTVTQTAGRF